MTNKNIHLKKLIDGCRQLELAISQKQCIQIMTHLKLLEKWNNIFNLTAVTDLEKMVVLHVLDSLSIHCYLRGKQILDIGSGGGFPGLPLSILFPNLQFTLLDSLRKKIEFLRYVYLQIGLINILLINDRIENYQPVKKFDTLILRAFSSLSDILKKMIKICHKSTRLIALKGQYPEKELSLLPTSLYKNINIKQIKVPFLKAQRHCIIVDF